MKNLISLIIILGTNLSVYAQYTSLSGRVIDKAGQPLPGATVMINGVQKGAVCDEGGNFEITKVRFGSYELEISMVGYGKRVFPVIIGKKKQQSLTITMSESNAELDEIVVIGKSEATRLRQSAQAVEVVETRLARLQTADLGEVLGKVQGVSVQRTGGLGSNTRFSLNGLTDDQVRFFSDGIPLDFIGYSFGIANVPVNLIERVEIYKGVVPVRFGTDALGGAVNLVSPAGFLGTGGSASYQVGSFGTHRAALNLQHQTDSASFFVRGSAFYDYSRNNYKIDVEVPDEQGRLSEATVRRFHDEYEAMGLNIEAGLPNKLGADILSVKGFANYYSRDIQHNNVMTVPFGEATSSVRTYGGLLRWQKEFNSGLSLDIVGGYSYNRIAFTDTSSCVYDWFGNCIRERASPGELGQASDQLLWDNNMYGRVNLKYVLGPRHTLSFSSAPTYVTRTGDERRQANPEARDPLTAQRDLFTFINGIEHEWKSADGQLQNIFFFKDYIQNVSAEEPLPGNRFRNRDRQSHDIGIGNSLRVRLSDQWALKASYEWATRMPRPREIFGNGVLIIPNLELEPERSHNANLELNYRRTLPSGPDWRMSISGFLRRADQLIILLGNDQVFSYQNVFAATSQGIEMNLVWTSVNDRLRLKANATGQDFRNSSGEGAFGAFEGDRIPNRPYLFANGSARYLVPEVLRANDELSFFVNSRYVHEFFRSWESAGLRQFKQTIPSQLVQNAGLTYRVALGSAQTAFTAEVQNLTNAEVFDFFGVQRPGRAYFVKLTTQF